MYSIRRTLRGHQNKKQKVLHDCPILFSTLRTSLGKPKAVIIRVLLDSGSSSTIINKRFVKNLRIRKKGMWNGPQLLEL
jgi:hypothetical protein